MQTTWLQLDPAARWQLEPEGCTLVSSPDGGFVRIGKGYVPSLQRLAQGLCSTHLETAIAEPRLQELVNNLFAARLLTCHEAVPVERVTIAAIAAEDLQRRHLRVRWLSRLLTMVLALAALNALVVIGELAKALESFQPRLERWHAVDWSHGLLWLASGALVSVGLILCHEACHWMTSRLAGSRGGRIRVSPGWELLPHFVAEHDGVWSDPTLRSAIYCAGPLWDQVCVAGLICAAVILSPPAATGALALATANWLFSLPNSVRRRDSDVAHMVRLLAIMQDKLAAARTRLIVKVASITLLMLAAGVCALLAFGAFLTVAGTLFGERP